MIVIDAELGIKVGFAKVSVCLRWSHTGLVTTCDWKSLGGCSSRMCGRKWWQVNLRRSLERKRFFRVCLNESHGLMKLMKFRATTSDHGGPKSRQVVSKSRKVVLKTERGCKVVARIAAAIGTSFNGHNMGLKEMTSVADWGPASWGWTHLSACKWGWWASSVSRLINQR